MSARFTAVAAGALAIAIPSASVYTIDAREVAVVTAFGASVRSVTEPGLYVRAPWPLHLVQRFDRRASLLEVDSVELLTNDKKNLVIEPFVIWRVADPERFLEAVFNRQDTVRTPTEEAELQLSSLVISQLGDALGAQLFTDLLSTEAEGTSFLPQAVSDEIARQAQGRLGIEVLRVELRHVGLPLQNEQSIYERMRAERLRIANRERAEGEEAAAKIRAQADRQAAEILAKAHNNAAATRAKAEGAAAKLYAESHRQDPGFYRFSRKLDAYRTILDEDTILVIDSESDLFELLGNGAP